MRLVLSGLCESSMPAITNSFQSCGGPSRRNLITDARATSKPRLNASCNDSRDGSFLRSEQFPTVHHKAVPHA